MSNVTNNKRIITDSLPIEILFLVDIDSLRKYSYSMKGEAISHLLTMCPHRLEA